MRSITDGAVLDELEEMPETCAEDLIERHGVTLDEIGKAIGVSSERIRQIEYGAERRIKRTTRGDSLRVFKEE